MTASLAQVRQGIKTVLEDVDGLDTVYGYVHGSPTPPCAIVGWPETYTFDALIGTQAWQGILPVQILVGLGDNKAADENLAALIDPVNEAFDADPTLGGVVSGYCVALRATNFGVATYSDPGIQYLSAIIELEAFST